MKKARFAGRLVSAASAVALAVTASPSLPLLNSPAVFAAEQAVSDYYFHDTFESGSSEWSGRGAAKVSTDTSNSFEGDSSLFVSGRTASWNGVSKKLSTTTFVPGQKYSISVNAMYLEGGETADFKLTMQYTDAAGKANYSNVAKGTVSSGQWIQLANTEYLIPEDASDLVLYVEVDEAEGAPNIDFYIDDAVAAPAGTNIEGAGQPKIRQLILGDVNFDECIDSFDLVAARQGLINGISDKLTKKAADVDGNGTIETADIVLISDYILGRTTEWPEPPKPDNIWDDYQETASADWINFYKSSIYSMGNTYRLTSKLEAAESGKPLTLAYLGGSITEGKNYSTPFSNYVRQTFAKGTFKEVNAGMSGTSSVVGLVRSEKDIVSANPDVIVLEFSVNDHEDIMYKKCFESCVKKFLSLPNDPAVIILINRAKGGFSSQAQMAAIGKNFKVPIISMDDALTKAFNSGFLNTSDYYTDEYHPHAKGGQLVADCMSYFLRQAMKTENRSDSYTIPTTSAYGSEYADCYNASKSDLQNFNSGSFTEGKGYGSLPYSYTFQKNSANTPMTFKVNGKGLILVFKANSSGMGTALVTVNGKTTKVSGNKLYTWGGPDAELGYYQDTSGELDVSIKMENAGTDFTIWGLGIIK